MLCFGSALASEVERQTELAEGSSSFLEELLNLEPQLYLKCVVFLSSDFLKFKHCEPANRSAVWMSQRNGYFAVWHEHIAGLKSIQVAVHSNFHQWIVTTLWRVLKWWDAKVRMHDLKNLSDTEPAVSAVFQADRIHTDLQSIETHLTR